MNTHTHMYTLRGSVRRTGTPHPDAQARRTNRHIRNDRRNRDYLACTEHDRVRALPQLWGDHVGPRKGGHDCRQHILLSPRAQSSC